jgi:multidrug resistance efflux pump
MAADGRRGPGVWTVLGLILLAGSVGVSAWWLRRPKPEPEAPTASADLLDVYCTGRVDAAKQVIPLEPSLAGRVVKIGDEVVEGGTVSAGREIFRLDDSAAQARLAQAKAAVEAARIDLDAAKADKQRFPKQVEAKRHLIAAATARVEAAKKALEQRVEQQKVTPLGKAEKEAIEAQILELAELEKAETLQLQEIEDREAKGQGNDLRIRAADAKLKAAQADEKLADKAVKECVVVAPEAGTVLRLQVSVGSIVGPGSPIAPVVFAPAGPLVVRAEVDQESLGRVRVGMAATVQDENRPDGPALKGRVKALSRYVAQKRTFVLEPGEVNDVRTVECVIELDSPGADELWIGQRMRVRILRSADRPSAPLAAAGR